MSQHLRRHFILGTLTGVGMIGRSRPLISRPQQKTAPSDTLGAAVIGVRGRGNGLLRAFAVQPDIRITHVCDIDESVLQQRCAELVELTGYSAKPVKDYRTILDSPEVDVVVLGTPDHWHALPTIQACQAGKDVYVEKPDGHDILEGRAMVAAARKYRTMVQLGTQSRSDPANQVLVDFVRRGGIGNLYFGRAWETDRTRTVPAVPDSRPPDGVDYDLWLGPAPSRPFNKNRFHSRWRWFFDYGTGDLGNDGVHRLDYCRWIMGIEEMPGTVSCIGGKLSAPDDAQEWPDHQIASYHFGSRIMTYEMRIGTNPPFLGATEGAAVYGDAGWVMLTGKGWKAFDENDQLVREMAGKNATHEHIRNFLAAVRSRRWQDLNQDIYSGHVSSFLCHAANISWLIGETLHLDTGTGTFDKAEANQYLGRSYRPGFELPEL